MAGSGTDDPQNLSSSTSPSSAPPARPSWETAPQPAAAPRQAPAPPAAPPQAAPPRLPELPASPYYSAPSAAAAPVPAAPVLDPSARYDLAGNLIPGSGGAGPSPMGQAAYAPGPPSGSWPPAPASPYSQGVGQPYGENGTDRVARLRWNWGAFLIPFWWSIFNGQKSIAWTIFLINGLNRVVPAPYDWGLVIASLGLQFYLGFMGNRLAWSSERFGGDYENFIRTQRAWMIWGFCLAGLLFGFFLVAAIALPGFLAALSGPAPVHHHSFSNGDGSGSASPGQQ